MQPLALDLRRTADALSISYKTLRKQLYSGRFPIPTRKLGGRVLVAVADINHFLATGHARPTVVSPPPDDAKRRPGRPKKGKPG